MKLTNVSLPPLESGKEYLAAISMIESLQDPKYSKNQRISKLLKMAPWIIHAEVGAYIRKYPHKIKALVLEVQKIGYLDEKQYLAVVWITLLIG